MPQHDPTDRPTGDAAVTITGAGGFIGQHVVRELLAEGRRVDAVIGRQNPFPHPPPPGLTVHRADLLDGEAASRWVRTLRPDALVHLAWYTVPGRYWTAPQNDQWRRAGAALLRALAETGCRRVVVIGTCAEYDWSDGVCSDISTPLRPATAYGIAKNRLREQLEETCLQAGMSGAWARLFFPYGPGEAEERLVPSVIRALMRQDVVRCTQGDYLRDYIYVRDVASALVALLDSGVTGAVNIASGHAVTIRQLVLTLVERFGGGGRVEFGAIPARENEPARLVADVRRLTEEVGWRPQTDLLRGLDETIAWWRHAR